MPAYAGAAIPEVIPGTTSQAIPSLPEGERLLTSAAEDERISPFEPHRDFVSSAALDQQPVDLFLRAGRFTPTLPHVDQLRTGRATLEHSGADQCIVHDRIGLRDQICRAHRQQAGITRSLRQPDKRAPLLS